MENCQLILNSNSLCVICLSEVEAKLSKADLFPLHHLTSKINSNLGDVFKDVTVPWAPNAVMDRLEVLADVCEECADLCEELLYKFQDEAGRENCIKAILDKMEGVGVEDKYKNCWSPAAVFYAGIVDRLRKEIIEKLHLKPELRSNQSATGFPAGLQGIPNLLNIPDLPLTQICSYLTFKDIISSSTVSKDLRRLVFPSLIKSSTFNFMKGDQITSMIDFIKAISNNFKKNVNLSIWFESLTESSEVTHPTSLQLLQECGPYIDYLKLYCRNVYWEYEIEGDLSDNNCLPYLGIGNELFPNMKKLEMAGINICKEGDDSKCFDDRTKAFTVFVEALLRNSPNLRGLKLTNYRDDVLPPSLFKLIGESGLPINTIEICECIRSKDLQNWTKFFESQSATLRHLSLEAQGSLPVHFTLPRMESLETFEFITDAVMDAQVGPLFYQTQFPKLEKLKVEVMNDGDLSTLFLSDPKPTTSVKELRLLLPTLEKDILVKTTRLFSSLSKVEVPVASHLNDLWKDLSGLEELTLTPKYSGPENSKERITWIDKIITGLSLTDTGCERPSVWDIKWHQERYDEMKGKTSLALLTRLKLLRLRDESVYKHTPNLLLGDIGCKVVLLKMESLKCIDFCGIHPSSVGASRKVLNEMGKKMDLWFGNKRAHWN